MKNVLIIIALCSSASIMAQNKNSYDHSKMEASMKTTPTKQSEPLKSNGVDPVCKMKVKKGSTITHIHGGKQYGFCNEYCKEVFMEKPEKYVKQ